MSDQFPWAAWVAMPISIDANDFGSYMKEASAGGYRYCFASRAGRDHFAKVYNARLDDPETAE